TSISPPALSSSCFVPVFLLSPSPGSPLALHSFPTRRSSDLSPRLPCPDGRAPPLPPRPDGRARAAAAPRCCGPRGCDAEEHPSPLLSYPRAAAGGDESNGDRCSASSGRRRQLQWTTPPAGAAVGTGRSRP